MNTAPLKLFVDTQFASPYAMSVFVGLHEKGLPFDMEVLDLATREHLAAPFAKASLTRRVPTLIHGDFALSESSAITEYLEDAFAGTPLYPREPAAKARARQVQAWLRSDLMPIRVERPTEVVFCGARRPPLSEAAQSAAEKLFFVAESLLAEGTQHLLGDWCIADVDLALMIQRVARHGDAVPARLAAYADHQWQRPTVQQWVKQTRPPLV